ncbi:MAG: hypothetical protein NT091_04375 [Candidatus Falkowbacteria bacterium]|nr:hypothetical protein [Candidatus Falkowbacteria bacterium]
MSENTQVIQNQKNCGERNICYKVLECSFFVQPIPTACFFDKGCNSPDCELNKDTRREMEKEELLSKK